MKGVKSLYDCFTFFQADFEILFKGGIKKHWLIIVFSQIAQIHLSLAQLIIRNSLYVCQQI